MSFNDGISPQRVRRLEDEAKALRLRIASRDERIAELETEVEAKDTYIKHKLGLQGLDHYQKRIAELEAELADEKAENGWTRDFLNAIGQRCGKPDCRSLVDYVGQLEALARELWAHVPPRERVGEGFAERMRALGLED